MIVECIIDTDFRGRPYKKGDQKNVLPEIAEFMISTEKWKGVGGQVRTAHEQKIMDEIEANKSEPEPVPVKVVEDVPRSRRKKKE